MSDWWTALFDFRDYGALLAAYPQTRHVMLGRGILVNPALAREIRGGASLTLEYQVLTGDDSAGDAPYAIARTVIVLVDAATGRPTRLAREQREALEEFSGPAQAFRD